MSIGSDEGETTKYTLQTRTKIDEVFIDLLRGSRGPSTVTLIARQYVATCMGSVFTVIVSENVFPVKHKRLSKQLLDLISTLQEFIT